MGGYADYVMQQPDTGDAAAGVCWSRGVNTGLPPVWLVYFVVASLDASLAAVRSRGGTVVRDASPSGEGRYAVIRDPGGAICALYEAGS